MLSTTKQNAYLTRVKRFAVITLAALTLVTTAASNEAQAATSPSIDECLHFEPVLDRGVQNQAGCVAALQILLSNANSNPSVARDGMFGPQTENHVIWFQATQGIATDGVVGPRTWDKIVAWCDVSPRNRRACEAKTEYRSAEPNANADRTRSQLRITEPQRNPNRSRQVVVNALEDALRARWDAMSPPHPDPDHPALRETQTDDGLAYWRAHIEGAGDRGHGYQYSTHSLEVESVAFDEIGGVDVAIVEACEISDIQGVDLWTGDVWPGQRGVHGVELIATMHWGDGAWKLDGTRVPEPLDCAP